MNRNRNLLYESELSKNLDTVYHFVPNLAALESIVTKGELLTGNKVGRNGITYTKEPVKDSEGNITYCFRISLTRGTNLGINGTKAFKFGVKINNKKFLEEIQDTIACNYFGDERLELIGTEYIPEEERKAKVKADGEVASLAEYKNRNLDGIAYAKDTGEYIIYLDGFPHGQAVDEEFGKVLFDGIKYLENATKSSLQADIKLLMSCLGSIEAKPLEDKQLEAKQLLWDLFFKIGTDGSKEAGIFSGLSAILFRCGYTTQLIAKEILPTFEKKYNQLPSETYSLNPNENFLKECTKNHDILNYKVLELFADLYNDVGEGPKKYKKFTKIQSTKVNSNGWGFLKQPNQDNSKVTLNGGNTAFSIVYVAGIISQFKHECQNKSINLKDLNKDLKPNYTLWYDQIEHQMSKIMREVQAIPAETAIGHVHSIIGIDKYGNYIRKDKGNLTNWINKLNGSWDHKNLASSISNVYRRLGSYRKWKASLKITDDRSYWESFYNNAINLRAFWISGDCYKATLKEFKNHALFDKLNETKQCRYQLKRRKELGEEFETTIKKIIDSMFIKYSLNKNKIETLKEIAQNTTDEALMIWNSTIHTIADEEEERIYITQELRDKYHQTAKGEMKARVRTEEDPNLIKLYDGDDLDMTMKFFLDISDMITGVIMPKKLGNFNLEDYVNNIDTTAKAVTNMQKHLKNILNYIPLEKWEFIDIPFRPTRPDFIAVGDSSNDQNIIEVNLEESYRIKDLKPKDIRHISISFKKYGL